MPTVKIKDVTFGSGPTKILVSITPANGDELRTQVAKLPEQDIDVLEWRVDFLEDLSTLTEVGTLLRESTNLPILGTFRSAAEGGQKAIMPDDYGPLVIRLIQSGLVDAVDAELFRTGEWTERIIQEAARAQIPVIGSYHDFRSTPPEDEIVNRLRLLQVHGASIAKIAVTPAHPGDVVTVLNATYRASQELHVPLITIAMGALGTMSRITSAIFGSAGTWGQAGQATAAGQIALSELRPVVDAISAWSSAPDTWEKPARVSEAVLPED
ncbi:type I 3-dehydroquinate dehydratase [Actinotignum schaalii]|uniref:type I 3-dehydroquinate dehydratase n=1 Tax=Actinotignum schaalii TaxID=59505 RepID=UPI0004220AA4|nr:type I 3-dehydroquinate dehydratase [Actinotignum schaalii]AIE83241.1 3-dehydroquinate dehydratase [Actinotignum schaalii]WQN45447.1 type I 3-dehydroquinate dehydratase [Actinotignum schaalii]